MLLVSWQAFWQPEISLPRCFFILLATTPLISLQIWLKRVIGLQSLISSPFVPPFCRIFIRPLSRNSFSFSFSIKVLWAQQIVFPIMLQNLVRNSLSTPSVPGVFPELASSRVSFSSSRLISLSLASFSLSVSFFPIVSGLSFISFRKFSMDTFQDCVTFYAYSMSEQILLKYFSFVVVQVFPARKSMKDEVSGQYPVVMQSGKVSLHWTYLQGKQQSNFVKIAYQYQQISPSNSGRS